MADRTPTFAYRLLWWLLLPAAVLKALWRSRREPLYREDFGQRFGVDRRAPDGRPTIWLHAVSVGETRAAAPLIAALLERYPRHRLLLTQMTAAGRQTACELYGERVTLAWLPWDLPSFQRRFLRHWQPDLALFMETEVWPALLSECRRAGVPAMLINARLSARSARGYARVGSLARTTFAALDETCAQTEADADRLRALGASPVCVTGNLKFDLDIPAEARARGQAWRSAIGSRPVVVLASTRDGEEAMLLPGLLEAVPQALIVVVPRHPQRFDAVAALISAQQVTMARRRDGDAAPGPDIRVWLGDSMGELFAWYALADVAVIGGSWLPLGGQNLIEACASGCPVVTGPHTFNFAQATDDAVAAGAALRANDVIEAAATVRALLGDPAERARRARSAHAFAQAHRGATARTLARIAARLPPLPATRPNGG
jgi:3-deoxy-D-manno-octulosonic-acid transferase